MDQNGQTHKNYGLIRFAAEIEIAAAFSRERTFFADVIESTNHSQTSKNVLRVY